MAKCRNCGKNGVRQLENYRYTRKGMYSGLEEDHYYLCSPCYYLYRALGHVQANLVKCVKGGSMEPMEAAEQYLSIANLMDFKPVPDIEKTANEFAFNAGRQN